MSRIQGGRSKRTNIIAGAVTAAALVGVLSGIGVVAVKANADAQAQANAAQAMAAAAPAYQGAISLGGDLDELAVKSVQAKAAYDAEQARIAAEQAAAAEAARVAAEQAAAQKAAADLLAAQQAAASKQTTRQAPTASSGASGAAAGTPLPMVQVTDPNNGQYGQMVPSVDPAAYCAAGSASTINGVPTCD